MSEKVLKCAVSREKGWLYFVDHEGDISRSLLGRKPRKKPLNTEVNKTGLDGE